MGIWEKCESMPREFQIQLRGGCGWSRVREGVTEDEVGTQNWTPDGTGPHRPW